MIAILSGAVAAVLGAVIGSFLNVCIHRVPLGTSVVWPASACPHCHRRLRWFENVPVASYLILRGRCRGCAQPISLQYPIVESTTAAMFALGWWFYGPSVELASRLTFGCTLIVLFVIDLRHRLLPNIITLPGILAGLAFSFFTEPGWVSSLVGSLAGGAILWGIAEAYYRVRHEEGLGMGDVKMLAMIGAFVGWKLAIVSLMLASFSGSLIGLGVIVTRRGDMKYALPFGTFLAIGAAAAVVAGPSFLDWYLRLW